MAESGHSQSQPHPVLATIGKLLPTAQVDLCPHQVPGRMLSLH